MRQRPIPLRAVTIDTAKHNENGRDLFRKAELQGRHASSNHTTASNLLDLQGETDTNIQAGEQFRLSSCQLDAAKAYQKAALLVSSEKLNKQERAALLYTEAALCLDKLDSSLAVAPFSQAVSQYCQASKYENAAATEERIARIHETNSQWESSVKHYQRAAKLSLSKKFSDNMSERAACLLEKNGEYLEASRLYRDLAFSCASRDLHRFDVPFHVLKSGILLLAQGGDTSQVRDLAQKTCPCSGELSFLNNLCDSVTRKDISAFADSLYSYNGMHELTAEILTALSKIKDLVCGNNEC